MILNLLRNVASCSASVGGSSTGVDCFLVSVHMCISRVGQECLYERSWNGGVPYCLL